MGSPTIRSIQTPTTAESFVALNSVYMPIFQHTRATALPSVKAFRTVQELYQARLEDLYHLGGCGNQFCSRRFTDVCKHCAPAFCNCDFKTKECRVLQICPFCNMRLSAQSYRLICKAFPKLRRNWIADRVLLTHTSWFRDYPDKITHLSERVLVLTNNFKKLLASLDGKLHRAILDDKGNPIPTSEYRSDAYKLPRRKYVLGTMIQISIDPGNYNPDWTSDKYSPTDYIRYRFRAIACLDSFLVNTWEYHQFKRLLSCRDKHESGYTTVNERPSRRDLAFAALRLHRYPDGLLFGNPRLVKALLEAKDGHRYRITSGVLRPPSKKASRSPANVPV